jgi:lysophospholipase-2
MPSKTHVTTRTDDGTTLILAPRNASTQSATVILCHGLGDTSDGWIDVAEQLSTSLPHVKFVLPTAPRNRVTMNMGAVMHSWYDITGLDRRSNENCRGIEESRIRIAKLIDDEASLYGNSRSRVALAGFSQGGALSLYVGMQLSTSTSTSTSTDGGGGGGCGKDDREDGGGSGGNRLGGIVILSGYLPHSSGFVISPGLENTPIFHGHGASDPLVNVTAANDSRDVVTSIKGGTNYRLVTYPNVGHSVSPREISDVLSFLREILPPDASFNLKSKDPGDMSIKELKAAIVDAGIQRLSVGLMEKSEYVDLLRRHRDGTLRRELRRAE